MSEQAAPAERQASAIPDDDIVLPFRVPTAGVMGRVVRLGGVVDKFARFGGGVDGCSAGC